jgi:hypothetical protein
MRNVDLTPVKDLLMSKGIGDFKTTACVVAQAAILDALSRNESIKKPTDELECACPVLRTLAITINDSPEWPSDHTRTESLQSLIPALLDSKISLNVTAKRAQLAAKFAKYAAKSADSAKSAEYAKYAAKSADSADYAAKSAAEYAEYAAEYAAKSADSAEYAAKYAAKSAKYAAKSAEYAKYAAKSADSAEYAAKYAAKSAKYAAKSAEYAAKYAAKSADSAEYAKYAEFDLKTSLLNLFWTCEAIKD